LANQVNFSHLHESEDKLRFWTYNAAVRLLGLALFLGGAAGVAYALRLTLARGRPADVAYALLAWLAGIIALLGLGLSFVPGFFG
jgi:hypothetical protein